MKIPGNGHTPIEIPGNGHTPIEIPAPVTVTVSQATADHILAWSASNRTRACHEAGHACGAALLGIPVNSASIKGQHEANVELGFMDSDQPDMLLNSTIHRIIVVYLAGVAAEIELLGEGSNGSTSDIQSATRWAQTRLDNGLERAWPPINAGTIWPFGGQPATLLNLQSKLVIAELTKARREAEALVKEHASQVLAFAGILFHARRLDGEALDAALRSVGLEPAPRGV